MAIGGIIGKIGRVFGFGGAPKPQTYGGTRPFESLQDIPEAREHLKTLRERMSGRGVGFSPGLVSKTVAPYAAQRRTSLRERELPMISATASARGLGRSTVPINQAALAGQAAERDIEDRVAKLSLLNEQQRRGEINQALQDFGQYPLQEARIRSRASDFNLGEWQRIQDEQKARDAEQMAGIKRTIALIGKTISSLGSMFGGGGGGAGGGGGMFSGLMGGGGS